MSQFKNKDENQNEAGDTADGVFKDIIKSFNRYATKKSLAQGFLDLALLFANIAQLKEIQKRDERDAVYYSAVVAISISLFLQILVGFVIAAVGKLNYGDDKRRKLVEKLNDIITLMLFLITIVNVIISMLWVFTDQGLVARNCKAVNS